MHQTHTMMKETCLLFVLCFLAVDAIKWKNCDNRSPAILTRFYMSPDPVVLQRGQTISFGGKFRVVGNVGMHYKVDIKMEKKAWFWFTIPCKNQVGSCTYDGISCEGIREWVNGESCPLPRKVYTLSRQSITLKNVAMPDFLKSGDYRLTINLRDANSNRRIACVVANIKARA